jgi:hypothetical protein
MTRSDKRILLGLALLILLFAVLEATTPKPVDWSLSYSRYHRKPYGAELVHERLSDLFPAVRSAHVAIQENGRSTGSASGPVCNRIFINTSFALDRRSVEELLQRVEQGDHLFIAAETISGALADTLNLGMGRHYGAGLDYTDLRFIGPSPITKGSFRFDRGFPGSHFTRYDSARTRVLAVDGSAAPVLLEMGWGKGRIVLSSSPRAFTNYNLLKGDNARYMAAALSILPRLPVVWDEHYKAGRTESSTPLRYILSQPALRWAWYLALALIALWIVVFSRRQQRAIPIVIPPRNASRALAHTIGRLYWQRGDHADLARKMIVHFKEELRQRTYLRSFLWDKATTEHIAAKCGLGYEETQRKLELLKRYETTTKASEQELLALSRAIHEFRRSLH